MLDNVDATLEHAISAHEAGNLALAGEKYLEILNVDPNHPDANHNFGLIAIKMEEKANEVLDKVGMKTKGFKYPHELSGGEQQRIAIARALLNDPELILADEPTGNLDPQTSAEVMNVLTEIHQNGKTILMVTHDYALLLKFPFKTLKCEDSKIFEVVQKAL